MKRSTTFRLIAAAVATAALSACSYYTYPIDVERKAPAVTGMDLSGKSMSVSFVQNSPKDSVFQSGVAEGFAQGLESMFFNGEQAVELFSLKEAPRAHYADRDTLINLALSTDSDVAFLFDRPEYILNDTKDTTFAKIILYAYDTMGEVDSVLVFTGKKRYLPMESFARNAGTQLSEYFALTWQKEQVAIYFYDETKWTEAAILADKFEWAAAMDKWLTIVSTTKFPQKRAHASYNVALACYLLGNYDYALLWLDRAESEAEIGQAASLRSKIRQRHK